MEYFQAPLIYFNPHCPLIAQEIYQYIQLRATPFFILRGRGGTMETENKNMWAWFRKKNPHCPLTEQVLRNVPIYSAKGYSIFILRRRGGRMETKNKNVWRWSGKKGFLKSWTPSPAHFFPAPPLPILFE